MWSLLADALSLAVLAVGGVLTAVRAALWVALILRGSEPPPAPRNVPLRRTSGDGNPPPPSNTRTRPRDDAGALKRYATVARERRGYAALVTATFLMALVLGGCGFLPPAVRTTHIETPTVSGVNAVASSTEVGGVISSTRVTVPPSNLRDCANFLDEALPAPTANTHPQTTAWMATWRVQMRLMCLRLGMGGGMGMGMMGPNMLGMGAFPGGLRYKAGGER